MSAPALNSIMLRCALFMAVGLALPHAAAHEGHDHGEPAPTPVSPGAPRAVSSTELFELVAVQDKNRLVIYLDRFADNSPVGGATVEVESGGWKAIARPIDEGTYAVQASELNKPGHHPLTFTITQGETGDLMQATLRVGDESAAEQAADQPSHWLYGLAAVPLLGLIAFLVRRRGPIGRRTHP